VIERLRNLDINYLSIYILFGYILCLPIANITAIQNGLFLLFMLIFIYFNFKQFDYKDFLKIKTFFIIFGVLLFLAIISSFYSINQKETLSEIRSEFIKPLIYFILIFFLINLSNRDKIIKLFFLLGCVLAFHTFLNIGIWIDNGGWPSRTGGLLDGTIVSFGISAAGERFGIWTTYALAFSISMLFTKYEKITYVFILIVFISIIANHTRATFIGSIFILFSYFIFFYKNKLIKFLLLFLFILSIISFTFYSKNFEERFNIYNMISSLKYLDDYTPSEFKILEDNYGLGHSTVSRLAMWKSVILYRMDEPFYPQSYGRFLYGKSLKEINKDKQENIPYVVYSQTHSDFMSMLFSLGIVGLIFFILLLSYTLKISYILTTNSNYKAFGIFVFLGTFGYIGSMIFGSFFGDTEQLFFYILLGAILALYVKHLNESKNEKIKTN
jgi:O-antigen ligase